MRQYKADIIASLTSDAAFRADVVSGMNRDSLAEKYRRGGGIISAARKLVLSNAQPVSDDAPYSVPQPQTMQFKPIQIGAATFDNLGNNAPRTSSNGLAVTANYTPPVYESLKHGAYTYSQFENESAEYLQRRTDNPPDVVEYTIKTDRPIAFVNLSDLHLGAKGTDHRRAREDALLITNTPGVFAAFGGDGIDNFIKIQAAMINADSTPEEQYAALDYWLSLFNGGAGNGGSMLGGVSGNHDYWTKQLGGIDYLRQLFAKNNIPYYAHRMRIQLRVNDNVYRIEIRHTYPFKSRLNQSNQLQRMYDLSDWQWDIGGVGHTHDGPFIVPFMRHGLERWGMIAGSYKGVDSHSEQWGYNAAMPNSPMMILGHEERSIRGVNDLRAGLDVLKALRAQ